MSSLNFKRAEDFIYQEVGRRIRNARRKRGLTQVEFAKKVTLARSSVTNIENGVQKITLHSLYEFAAVLRVSIYELLPENKY